MKLNLAAPNHGLQKLIELDDEKRLQNLYDKRMAQEVDGSVLGDEFAGYVFKITGGNDKQGFPMRQGILTTARVRILCGKGQKGYRPRRKGERKRKSLRGCIVSPEIAVLNLVIVKEGENTIPGLTDHSIPRRLGPKRASNIRKLFNLSKKDDVRKYVISRTFVDKKGRTITKTPKIQRLITPVVLRRRRVRKEKKMAAIKRNYEEAVAYKKLLAKRAAEKRAVRKSLLSKRRSERMSQKLAGEKAKEQKTN